MIEQKRARLKLIVDEAGRGSAILDGMDIGHCVTAISFKASAGALTEIQLIIMAEVDAEITACLDQIALRKEEPKRPEGIIRSTDGRELKIRSAN